MSAIVGRITSTLLVIAWFLIVPMLFAVLYTVIEVQSAAKATMTGDGKLAAFLVLTRAQEIETLRIRIERLAGIVEQSEEKEDHYLDEWHSVRAALRSALMELSAAVFAFDLEDQGCLDGDGYKLPRCVSYVLNRTKDYLSTDRPKEAERSDIEKLESSVKSLFRDLVQMEAQYWNFNDRVEKTKDLYNTVQARHMELVGLADALSRRAAPAGPDSNAASEFRVVTTDTSSDAGEQPGTIEDLTGDSYEGHGETAQLAEAQPQQAGPPANTIADERALGSVAATYASLKSLWVFGSLFATLFLLPNGAIVAFFTAIMGAIGAGVRSLLRLVRQPEGDHPAATLSALYAFGAYPLLGAMAGFMVFFVISAGAAFLVQPSGGTATEAVNSLSPAALASLGVFAGLAAEDALLWLRQKATSFFQRSESSGASRGAKLPAPQNEQGVD